MIYIEFKEGQGLGNQLWLYSTLRSISEYKQLDYGVFGFKNFKGSSFLDIKESSNIILKKKKINYFYEKTYEDKDLKNISCDYDDSILQINDNTILRGIFQSEKYLLQETSFLNKYIKIKESVKYEKFNSEQICILNIRGGEYKRHKNLILPKSYWENAILNIKKMNSDLKFAIVTDDERYASKLFPNIEIFKGDIAKDFLNLMHAKYLILSNSSFSYFPINLKNKPKIVLAPLYWSRFGNKFNKWSSPANCYEDWLWQNEYGEILSKENVKKTLFNTKNNLNKKSSLITKEYLFKNDNLIKPIQKIKKLIKKLLGIIFPLKFG